MNNMVSPSIAGFIQDFRVGGGIKCMRKYVTRALITFWKFLSRKIIQLHFNLHTTVSINLFIHCTISIVYIIIRITSF